MSAFESLRIAGSGLGMHQTWLDALSHNIANIGTVRSTAEDAFQAQLVVAESREDGGVRVREIALSSAEGRMTYQPDHPLADADVAADVLHPGGQADRSAAGQEHRRPGDAADQSLPENTLSYWSASVAVNYKENDATVTRAIEPVTFPKFEATRIRRMFSVSNLTGGR